MKGNRSCLPLCESTYLFFQVFPFILLFCTTSLGFSAERGPTLQPYHYAPVSNLFFTSSETSRLDAHHSANWNPANHLLLWQPASCYYANTWHHCKTRRLEDGESICSFQCMIFLHESSKLQLFTLAASVGSKGTYFQFKRFCLYS